MYVVCNNDKGTNQLKLGEVYKVEKSTSRQYYIFDKPYWKDRFNEIEAKDFKEVVSSIENKEIWRSSYRTIERDGDKLLITQLSLSKTLVVSDKEVFTLVENRAPLEVALEKYREGYWIRSCVSNCVYNISTVDKIEQLKLCEIEGEWEFWQGC